ncbi:MAG: GlcG/HbpS family heme-binding protein [bacterium]
MRPLFAMTSLLIALNHPLAYADDQSTNSKTPTQTSENIVDAINVKQIGMDLANDLAKSAVLACREEGYNVSVVVVDRAAQAMVVLRDTLAPHFTIQIAEEKANAVILSGIDSAGFRANRNDIKDEMNEVEGIMVLDGGLKISAAGATLGAIGVSGAPGGDKDAACAQKALEQLNERLEFME